VDQEARGQKASSPGNSLCSPPALSAALAVPARGTGTGTNGTERRTGGSGSRRTAVVQLFPAKNIGAFQETPETRFLTTTWVSGALQYAPMPCQVLRSGMLEMGRARGGQRKPRFSKRLKASLLCTAATTHPASIELGPFAWIGDILQTNIPTLNNQPLRTNIQIHHWGSEIESISEPVPNYIICRHLTSDILSNYGHGGIAFIEDVAPDNERHQEVRARWG
jgi:hypothetical protein